MPFDRVINFPTLWIVIAETRHPRVILMGTSKNRFEKGKWVECAECEETLNKTKSIRSNEQIHASDFVTLRFIQLILYESRRSKAVCLTRRFDDEDGAHCTFSLT